MGYGYWKDNDDCKQEKKKCYDYSYKKYYVKKCHCDCSFEPYYPKGYDHESDYDHKKDYDYDYKKDYDYDRKKDYDYDRKRDYDYDCKKDYDYSRKKDCNHDRKRDY